MKLSLSVEVLLILFQLQKANKQAFIVGGAVRDLILDKKVTDFDFTTDATPEEILNIFPNSYYENEFGMVAITSEHLLANMPFKIEARSAVVQVKNDRIIDLAKATKIHQSLTRADSNANNQLENNQSQFFYHPYEITTFRSDGLYNDHRRPETVTWGKSLTEDLARRDFTINAMAIEIDKQWLTNLFLSNDSFATDIKIPPTAIKFIDPHLGQADLAAGIIKTVGNPSERFREDALRMLRAVRFSAQLQFALDRETASALQEHSQSLQHISSERIRDEFLKILLSNRPSLAIEQLEESGLLQIFLPELIATKNVRQAGHHTTDVWYHSLDALDNCPSNDPIVKLATLLHDIAKPNAYMEQNGTITFYNHEIIGAHMAKEIGYRLRLSKKDINRLFILVRNHMFHYQVENNDAAVRRIMRRVGLENIDDMLDLREGDRLGSGATKTSWRLEELKARMIEQLHQPFDVTDLAINGTDLMENLNLKPGKIIGEILHHLFDMVIENPELNEKEKLLELAKQFT